VPQLSCSSNNKADNIRGIIYYSYLSPPILPSLPNTTAYTVPDTCEDENPSNLIPLISQDLNITATDAFYNETLPVSVSLNEHSVWRWILNGTSMQGNWSQPTLQQLLNTNATKKGTWTTNNDEISTLTVSEAETWVLVIIETSMAAPHPIHLHGHDFLVVAQGAGPRRWPQSEAERPRSGIETRDGRGSGITMYHAAGSLPKRDTALLPALGHLVLAFRSDNPGAWWMHCHIGWHLEQGFALQFVERGAEVWGLFHGYGTDGTGWASDGTRRGTRHQDRDADWGDYARSIGQNCAAWDLYDRRDPIWEDGAAI
jgi:hypothetical protein